MLDVMERLVVARYDRRRRAAFLEDVNLKLERMRFLLRITLTSRVMPKTGFETAMRALDETGRMLHGWRRRSGTAATSVIDADSEAPSA